MKVIDTRFNADNLTLFRGMCGQIMNSVKCDPFQFSTAVYGVVGICMDGYAIRFTNNIEIQDYFGALEDVAVFRMKKSSQKKICSQIIGSDMIELPIQQRISKIIVINEHQTLFKNDVQTYSVELTRGIIFKFDDGLELSIEKDIWFSEFMDIRKGYDLINQFASEREFADGWAEPYRGECTRTMISIEI